MATTLAPVKGSVPLACSAGATTVLERTATSAGPRQSTGFMTPSPLVSTSGLPSGHVGPRGGGGGVLQSSALATPSPLRSVMAEPSGHAGGGGGVLQSSL